MALASTRRDSDYFRDVFDHLCHFMVWYCSRYSGLTKLVNAITTSVPDNFMVNLIANDDGHLV